MPAPRHGRFESVAAFVLRYNQIRSHWEREVDSGRQADLGITKEKLRKLDVLKIPKGVNKDSLIQPSEDWIKEHSEFRKYWESRMKKLRRGEEIIEAKALSDAFMNDPLMRMIEFWNYTRHPASKKRSFDTFKPTLESGPSQPVLPPSRAQQRVQPSFNTAGFLSTVSDPIPDFLRHSKLNDDPINTSTSSLMPSQTPDSSNSSSATQGAITRSAHGDNSSTDGWINQ
ncbi:hypothetical protein BGAL_0460g00090 [Botrytis galanthina]|uniref:Uncharacterized protein n=1 Tax=Botrytis galanthina TaxID=278940 RepID=A0A4S8QY16_9HELO|nr:hypothetical protein BGAL_0460g00090 [Botrytis galanthina]